MKTWLSKRLILACLLLLTACQSPSKPSTAIPATRTQAAQPTVTLEPQIESATEMPAGPTPVLIQGSGQPELQAQPVPEAATPLPDPLRFNFPTPGPAPVSAWRPPLYPTPWAPTPYDHFYFSRPIAADEVNWPLAEYRYGGVFLPNVVHTGVDIPAPKGTPVLAAGPGKITWAGYGLFRGVEDPTDPYGLAVAIKHDFGYNGESLFTVYGHMDVISVTRGMHLQTGDVIGLVGETGRVTGPHLHFEVRIGRNNFFVTRNPELWMAPPQGWGLVAGRVMDRFHQPLFGQVVKVLSIDTGQTWSVNTYGSGGANGDPYYRENVAMGDLPAGHYLIWIPYEGSTYDTKIEIRPGMVTYFTFLGEKGFSLDPPPTPQANFTPPVTNTPIVTGTPTP
jgi:murein DD-endopeptidase MepM/ murein hydrolase activator NlpD